MFIIILAAFWTMLCSWVFWMALLAVGAFILGWLFRTPKIDEWKQKYEGEVSSNSGFAKKYSKLEKSSTSFNKEKSSLERKIEKQKAEIATFKNKTVKLENDFRSAASERDSLSTKMGLLNSEITGLKSTGDVVEVPTDENEKEVDRLTTILHNRDSEIDRLRNSVSEVKAEKDEYIRRSESYRPRFEDANLERNTLKVKYEKLVAATASISSADVDLAGENKSLKEQVAQLKAQVPADAPEVVAAPVAPVVDTSAMEAELASLRKAQSRAATENSDLQIKYESLLRHNEQLEASSKVAAPTPSVQNFAAAAVVADMVTPVAPVAPAAPVAGAEDDLKKIEGIGPKIEELIKNGGIKTWAALSTTDPSVIQGFLDAAGPRYKMHTPLSWPLQAGMAARGEWEALEKWQDEHDNGKM